MSKLTEFEDVISLMCQGALQEYSEQNLTQGERAAVAHCFGRFDAIARWLVDRLTGLEAFELNGEESPVFEDGLHQVFMGQAAFTSDDQAEVETFLFTSCWLQHGQRFLGLLANFSDSRLLAIHLIYCDVEGVRDDFRLLSYQVFNNTWLRTHRCEKGLATRLQKHELDDSRFIACELEEVDPCIDDLLSSFLETAHAA